MPGGDRTGPLGEGARTGRGAGYCNGNNAPGFMNDNTARTSQFGFAGRGGRGFRAGGGGRGMGNRRRNMFYETGLTGWQRFNNAASPSRPENEEVRPQSVQNQIVALKSEIETLRKKLNDIESNHGEQ